MDIYGAQKSVEKLLKYAQGLADSKPTMYAKSKDRLKDLAATCTQVVELISMLLQDEVLSIDVKEFSDSSRSVVTAVDNMQTSINQLHLFTSPSVSSTTSDDLDNSHIFQNYKKALTQITSNCYTYQEITNCAKLLHDWFEFRFIKFTANSKFRYNLKYMFEWIRDIVILYGYALHTSSAKEFCSNFYNWIDSLMIPDNVAAVRYAVPFSVYQFGKSFDKTKLCLESLVIWDVLVDSGLYEICKPDSEYYGNSESLYVLCDQLNPECLDNYRNYKDHPEIFSQLGWNIIRGAANE